MIIARTSAPPPNISHWYRFSSVLACSSLAVSKALDLATISSICDGLGSGRLAAKAALASVKQGKYDAFHEALLGHKGHYDKAAVVDDIAKSVGLDMDKLHKDMDSPEIMTELDQNIDLGRSLNITGTPGFIIGDQIVSGASSVDELKKFVANACKAKG